MSSLQQQPICYNYGRFSNPGQAVGDSERRQDDGAAAWCKRNGVRLDATLDLWDRGTSAFRGAHRKDPERHALAAFLQMVQAGKIPPGSYLLVEAIDRLTRENPVDALSFLLDLIRSGIRIVALKPSEMVYDRESGAMKLIMASIEVERGHNESAVKSDRVAESWVARREAARDQGEILTRRLPLWVREQRGRLLEVPERADVIRLIFKLAIEGRGAGLIVQELKARNVPLFGKAGCWDKAYVGKLLIDRRVLGEFQPRFADGRSAGEPIEGYYPQVITPQTWDRARAAVAVRRAKRGRVGPHVNLFAGLIRHARDGSPYCSIQRNDEGRRHRVLGAGRGDTHPVGLFPYEVFEEHLLDRLIEIRPAEVLAEEVVPDEMTRLLTRKTDLVDQLAEVARLLEEHPSRTLARRAEKLEAEEAELNRQLAEARQKAASPAGEAWADARPLLALLQKHGNDQASRLHARALLRRMIQDIYLLVVGRGVSRLAVAQLWFKDGVRSRTYLILHHPPRANGRGWSRPGRSWCESYPGPGEIDLRKPEDVALAEAFLLALDLK
jgi:DNA invertase Pin-like site-specific DNA recombinase